MNNSLAEKLSKINNADSVLFFDGTCILCNRALHFFCKLNTHNRFLYCSLQYANQHNWIPLPYQKIDSMLFYKQGTWYAESDAVIEAMRAMQGVFHISVLLYMFPRFIRDTLYRIIANNRYKVWGTTSHCSLLTPKLKGSILDYM